MAFTRMSFDILDGYLGMVRAAASDLDYAKAAALGEKTLAVREKMTDMSGIFTTYRKMGEHGPAWWPGEVKQYARLATFLAGTNGTLVQKLPLEWAFRRDKARKGVDLKFASQPVDLAYWNANQAGLGSPPVPFR